MTPRQFYLLLDRHKVSLAHDELCTGFIAAAVYNTVPGGLKEPLTALDFMPNHPDHADASPEMSEEQLRIISDFNTAVLARGLAMKAAHQNGRLSGAKSEARRTKRRSKD